MGQSMGMATMVPSWRPIDEKEAAVPYWGFVIRSFLDAHTSYSVITFSCTPIITAFGWLRWEGGWKLEASLVYTSSRRGLSQPFRLTLYTFVT